MPYHATIGIEVHAQLQTASKMFCACRADYAAAPPNTLVCPVDLGLPGALPVINAQAVAGTVLTGLALGCRIAEVSWFDRKNYPYPDLPKGYQISQYDHPLCSDGGLEIEVKGARRRIAIRRVHLEEDTAKLTHAEGCTLVDFNRAGVPLMEIVSEPDMHTPEEAYEYVTRLRSILRYLGVNSGDMEKGALRLEVNVSVAREGERGTKVEIKNLNSFRAVLRSLEYEIARQTRVLESGGRVAQVTMGWDETREATFEQRTKEEAHDYRYFPEPDLPPLVLERAWVEGLRAQLPELPGAKADRYQRDYGLSAYDAGVLTAERPVAEYFEAAVAEGGVDAKTIANWMSGELFRLLRAEERPIEESRITPAGLVALLRLIASGRLTAASGKQVLAEMWATGEPPAEIAQARGLAQISDRSLLEGVVARVLSENPGPVAEYLAGKEAILRFLFGQVMRATRGQANPQLAQEVLQQALERRRGERS
ncbi:MAG TPA: Asp-tRNA(Asn)/Glu-tRNA(Gln) amidotransferase subunit GatB [Anaerolineae bacterium]|nr:Asp-tRNA(Asn)/Glu-tRNA(Gln) amidotransferase subunit GatB [Anaerolineae bacterium]HOQ98148.1 Asp-tRNA(Asn)/Glu-tRNA(Gln) amidotransferase subunit GatB [Anaerolineae bacterium]HPL30413.1 Asp-tRNA(Asn)/Glu-tRNA(Gln) amidotransferase subunit GatB [Anaerolineae bacterium]